MAELKFEVNDKEWQDYAETLRKMYNATNNTGKFRGFNPNFARQWGHIPTMDLTDDSLINSNWDKTEDVECEVLKSILHNENHLGISYNTKILLHT